MSSNGRGRDPASYARPDCEPEEWVDVPVIDISPLIGGDAAAKAKVAQDIARACGRNGVGFFYASNHGVDTAAHELATARLHREISSEEKFRVAVRNYNPANTNHMRAGYYMSVPGKKANESFCLLNPSFCESHPLIRVPTPLHEVNQWPTSAAPTTSFDWFRTAQEQHFWKMFELSAVLLRGFALALGAPEDLFLKDFRASDTLSALSLIRYPFLEEYPPLKVAADGTKLSFDDHYDVSLITVLYQSNVANLQLLGKDGRWRSVPANDACFLVNGGSFMELLTKGVFPTPLHRVKFVPDERLSIPFFAHLASESILDDPRDESKKTTYGQIMLDGLVALIKKNGHT